MSFRLDPPDGDIGLRRAVERFPFVPADESRLEQDCYEAYNIQVSGLEQRLRAIGRPKLVIGVSGGLDSTHALIVAAQAMDRVGRPRSDILGFTLPGFATGERTKGNAMRLMQALGVTWEELDITATARLMLTDLGHPFSRGEPVYDVTFENVQAGLRTDYLFRAANQRSGIVLGTGDLSELALGWCTYGVGDQMSHYNVNGGVPKTLIQHLIRWVVSSKQFETRWARSWQTCSTPRSPPSWSRPARTRRSRAARPRSAPTPCRTSPSSTCCATGSAPPRSRSWPGTPGATRTRGLAAGFPADERSLHAGGDPPLARGLRAALLRVQPVQALRAAERPQGVRGRVAVAAGRLASALGHVRPNLAGRGAVDSGAPARGRPAGGRQRRRPGRGG